MIAPHTSCRYVVGIHAPSGRTLIGAVHALERGEDGSGFVLIVSRVDSVDRPGEDAPVTTYGLPQVIDAKFFQAMAPNLGEAHKVLRAMLAAGGR